MNSTTVIQDWDIHRTYTSPLHNINSIGSTYSRSSPQGFTIHSYQDRSTLQFNIGNELITWNRLIYSSTTSDTKATNTSSDSGLETKEKFANWLMASIFIHPEDQPNKEAHSPSTENFKFPSGRIYVEC
jgi:hypothetical protein